jgi:hypothetical protein
MQVSRNLASFRVLRSQETPGKLPKFLFRSLKLRDIPDDKYAAPPPVSIVT